MPPRLGWSPLNIERTPEKWMLPKWLEFYNMKYRDPLREWWDESPSSALDRDESPHVISIKEKRVDVKL